MGAPRRCTECPNSLAGKLPTAVTCSVRCRGIRARRIKRQNRKKGRAAARPAELAPFTDLAVQKDVAAEVLRDELRPMVREAITEEVLMGVQRLVGLTPLAIAKLEEDLESSDPTIRQRAYTLLMKYTMGNPSVAPANAEAAPAPMQVVFNMPRPADTGTPEVQDAEVVEGETKLCVECDQIKPEDEFVGNSERCTLCHDALQARVDARFGDA